MASPKPGHDSPKKSFLRQGWAKTKPAFFSFLTWLRKASKYVIGAVLLAIVLHVLNVFGYYATLYSIYTRFYDWLRGETNLPDQHVAILSIWLSITGLYCGLLLLAYVFIPRWLIKRVHSWSSSRYRLTILVFVGLFFSFFFAVSYWLTEPTEGENFNNKGEPRRRYIACDISPTCPDGFHAVPLFKEYDRLSGQALEILTREKFQLLIQRKKHLEEEKSRKEREVQKRQEELLQKEKELKQSQENEARLQKALQDFDSTLIGENLAVRAESISVSSRFTDVFVALTRRESQKGARITGEYSAKRIFLVDAAGNAYEAQGAVVLDPDQSSVRSIRNPEYINAGQSLRLKIYYKPLVKDQDRVTLRAGEYVLATNVHATRSKNVVPPNSGEESSEEAARVGFMDQENNDTSKEKSSPSGIVTYRIPEPPRATVISVENSEERISSDSERKSPLYKSFEPVEWKPGGPLMKPIWSADLRRGFLNLRHVSIYRTWVTLHISIGFYDNKLPPYSWEGYFSNGNGLVYPSSYRVIASDKNCDRCSTFELSIDRLSVENTSLYLHSREAGFIDLSTPMRETLARR